MRKYDKSPLNDLVFDCCRELFAAYDLALTPADLEFPPQDRLAFCSVMGFGGRQLRGALVLASTREPLDRTNEGDNESQNDWICELSNQLMGRIKNRLLSLGTEVLLATPAALSGRNLDLTTSRSNAPQVFQGAGGLVCVWIEYECLDGFELPTTPSGTLEAAIPEGEALLF